MIKGGQYQIVPVEQIELDKSNPRIRKFLEMYGDDITPEQFYLALGAASDDEQESSASFEKLKNSIITNGGIIQPIILSRRTNGTYLCVEGNTRVALYKSFIEGNVKGGDWTQIPSLVYEDMAETEIDAIRLQVHLVGTRSWDPYSKAKYLHQLRTQQHLPFAEIVEFSGGRQKEIVDSINAFSDMEQHYRPILADDGEFDTRRFSGFVELQKVGIKEAILGAGFTLSDFARWIHSEKFSPLNTIRALPRILRNQKSREVFLKHDAKSALKILEHPDVGRTLSEAGIGALAQALTRAIYALNWRDAERLRNDPGSETAQHLSEASAALNELMTGLADNT